ncbi:MAG: type II secretion system F family protein [Desulfohalobiaceae bacterium]
MQYNYKAIDDTGSTVSGSIEAESPYEAQEKLASQGYIPQKVSSASGSSFYSLKGLEERLNLMLATVKTPELILFTKQLRTLFNAGINITNLLQILEQQTDNLKLKKVAAAIGQDIQSGISLSEAFAKHPKIFSNLYCSMIQAGEDSGRLGEVLDRLVYLLQHEHKVRSDIKSVTRYPKIVLGAMFIAFLFLLTFILPQFIEIFEDAGVALPLPTRINIALYEFIIGYWPVLLGGIVLAIVGVRLYLKTAAGQFHKDWLILKLPIIGPVFQKGAMARFANIFSILQASGVSVLNTLSVLSGTIGNAAISREFVKIQDQLREGKGISEPLKSARYFTPMVVNMVAVGEESGNLDEMLSEISSHYDDEVDFAVKRMADNLGPALIAALAVLVGFFAASVFLPMWDLAKTI